jgi:GAF domain-containing protein
MTNTFGKPIIPDNEEQRIKALRYYTTLQQLPERFFNNLAHIIAQTFNTPIALISLVEEDNVFFKGNFGMESVANADRGVSLCSLAILDNDPIVFTDALKEPCLLANPLVAGDFGLRFYAGAPITTPEGFHIGTVCVVDKKPRAFTQNERDLLVQFANNAMELIQQRSAITSDAISY